VGGNGALYTHFWILLFSEKRKKKTTIDVGTRGQKKTGVGLSNKLQLQDIHFFDSQKTQNLVFEQKAAFKTWKRKINF